MTLNIALRERIVPISIAIGAGMACFLVASLTLHAFGITTPLWFSNAIALAVLLRARGKDWPLILVAFGCAEVSAMRLFVGGPYALLSSCDFLEVLVAALALRISGGFNSPIFDGKQLARLVIVCLSAPVLSAALGSGVLTIFQGAPFVSGWQTWYSASALGLLIVTPFLLIWSDREVLKDQLQGHAWRRTVAMALPFLILSFVLFGQGRGPLLFLLYPALLVFAWTCGLLGSTAGLMLLALIGAWFIVRGDGALVTLALPALGAVSRINALQYFLVAASFSSLPMAVVIASLRRATARAESASAAKANFIANMSHEIRTPLNGVLGVASVLAKTCTNPQQKEMTDIILDSAGTLERLLNDVLDTARVASGRLEIRAEPYDCARAVEHSAALFRPVAEGKGLEFCVRLTSELRVMQLGDQVRLQQILTNLLNNAAKFTERGSVTLCAERRGGDLVFEVIDTGVGFDGNKAEALFRRFEQADASISERFGGTGLGLGISRDLAGLMGGWMSATSIPGKGSTFTLSIPFRAAPAQSEETIGVGTTPQLCSDVALRALLADDHPTNRRVVELMLTAAGIHCVSVEDGALAVEALEKADFDFVLMDMQMPVMDGLTAIRAIRAKEAARGSRSIPILVLSANALSEHLQDSTSAGADGHLAKPIIAAQLYAAIADLLKSGAGADVLAA